ncbi:ATP-binding cassette domain-containing protein [Leifsonia poae]|uniref:Daunorubicin resistance protein DrrA family ABC transporter ATP-binding protein n=1 Tax=Leifsonia poae TaxID=110933 RepID=A0A9W6LZZ2_9MICO|nr:ATP-binding cassette domain-containing protein [Leifsonia poae]GLJ76336.1 daunorubicin resistance protein DrrA family ABC transporter ATP-binding protein [Leifsonia poae]
MATALPSALIADDLVKTYRAGRGKTPVRALDGLSFDAEAGTVFGLLGPNGAGKSTTIKILSSLARADSGRAFVAGIDVGKHPARVRRAIGFVAQKSVADPMDTGVENLVLAGRLQGLSARGAHARASELLDRFGLTEHAKRQVKGYSGGMARKLDVAIGLMHHPEVLFLDEPTTGLDPEARAELWAEIERMTKHENMTVLLTTHYLEEADRLASRLAIVDHGTVVAGGTPEELKNDLRGDAVIVELTADGDPFAALAALQRVDQLREVGGDGRTLRARSDNGAATLPLALAALEAASVTVASATVARPSLDDVYLRHTGRTLTKAQENFAVENAS